MKRLLLNFSCAGLLVAGASVLADDAELLTGKWLVKKVNDQGQNFTQTIEVKKDKFIFQILGADGQVAIYAEGDLKLEKLGPFNSARFYHIRGGQSAADLQDVDQERFGIYTIDGDTWTMAANFENDRQQKPSLDVYQRVKAGAGAGGQSGMLVIDALEMADTPQSATWYVCLEAKLGDVSRRYYVENKGYEKSQVTIPMALEFPKAQAGQKCTFKLQLDDIDGDACSDEPDNRSTGEFTVSEKGSQSFKPEDNWRFTIRWHIK